MTKLPPGARVPPFCMSPLVNAPVVKVKDPRFAPTAVPYLIKVEPARAKPPAFPMTTPPALTRPISLAKPHNGRPNATDVKHATYLMLNYEPPQGNSAS